MPRIALRHHQRDEATHAVPDDNGVGRHAGGIPDRDHFGGPLLEAVGLTAAVVSVAGQVQGRDAVLRAEHRCDVIPPAGGRDTAVHGNDPGRVSRPPASVGDRTPVDLGREFLRRHGERAAEPLWDVQVNPFSARLRSARMGPVAPSLVIRTMLDRITESLHAAG